MPSRLGAGNATWWQDICDVLLDPQPDRTAAETVRRWLRDQVEEDLRGRLARANHAQLVAWACRLAPRMIWKLPCSFAKPPARFHRRIVAVLLPHKLALLERQLARLAFSWQMRPAAAEEDSGV